MILLYMRLTSCALVIQFDSAIYFFCFSMVRLRMSAMCVVFRAAPHYLTLSFFCDDSQAPTLGNRAQETGRDVI